MDKSVVVSDFLLALLVLAIWKTSAQRQCPRLQKPWNGQFIGSCNRQVGSECQFACREPYRLVGSQVRLCRTDGTWSGRTSACELDVGCNTCGSCNNCGGCSDDCNGGDSTCPSLYSPEGGYTEGQCSPGVVTQTCVFRCNAGYVREGPERLTCLSNGQWNSQTPYCRRTSGAICESFIIPNGDATCDLEVGVTVCRVTCHAGYMLVGSSIITCSSSGNWNEQFPICRSYPEVTNICQTLVAPEGGRLVGSCSAANTGDTCQLVCISGYRPSDTRVLVCQSNGLWSSTLPRCISSITSSCTSIQVPGGTTSGTCNPGSPGQSCTVTCQSGYTLVGNPTLICQANGQWSSVIPSCTAQACTTLLPPQSGTLSGSCSAASVGQSCTFSCFPGYTLSGQATLYCQPGGIWSSSAPICVGNIQSGCSSLVAPSNGYMQGTCSPGRVGETCVFFCNSNYVLRGQRTITCQSGGRWSDYTPICERREVEGNSCPILNPPPNGNFEECDNRPGGRCIVVCQQGYLRSGSRVRTCLSGGLWSGYSPTCTRRTGYTTYTYKVVPLWSLVFG